jgi:hypothetical protein
VRRGVGSGVYGRLAELLSLFQPTEILSLDSLVFPALYLAIVVHPCHKSLSTVGQPELISLHPLDIQALRRSARLVEAQFRLE